MGDELHKCATVVKPEDNEQTRMFKSWNSEIMINLRIINLVEFKSMVSNIGVQRSAPISGKYSLRGNSQNKGNISNYLHCIYGSTQQIGHVLRNLAILSQASKKMGFVGKKRLRSYSLLKFPINITHLENKR